MNKITGLLIDSAHAQFGGGGQTSSFNWNSFVNILNPLHPNSNADAATRFNTLVGQIIGIVLTVAALIAFIYLLVAGFQYITAGGDAAKATAARTGIVNAIIGIIVIVISYLLLRFVAGLF